MSDTVTDAMPDDDADDQLERAERSMFYAEKRDQFAAAALPALLSHAVIKAQQQSNVVALNGQSAAKQPPVTTLSRQGIEWAAEAAFDVAEAMLAARAGQLPAQVARLKAEMVAADKAASPAAAMMGGAG